MWILSEICFCWNVIKAVRHFSPPQSELGTSSADLSLLRGFAEDLRSASREVWQMKRGLSLLGPNGCLHATPWHHTWHDLRGRREGPPRVKQGLLTAAGGVACGLPVGFRYGNMNLERAGGEEAPQNSIAMLCPGKLQVIRELLPPLGGS